MTFDERINKLKDYSRKTEAIIKVRCKMISDKFANVESEFCEFLSVFKAVMDIERNSFIYDAIEKGSSISIGEHNGEYIIILTDKYVINSAGKLAEVNEDDSISVCDCEKTIMNLMLDSDQSTIAQILERIDGFLADKVVVFEAIDKHLSDIDEEYKTLCSDTDKNFAEMFSVENVITFDDNGVPEEVYDANNLPDDIKLRINMNRIPEMKSKKIKSHYEIYFNDVLGKGVCLNFMMPVSRIIKVSDTEVDVLLDRDDHYTVYMQDDKKSRRKVFTGAELYKLNKEYVTLESKT